MKILFPQTSWAGGFMYSIAKAFRNLGHETEISTPSSNQTFLKYLSLGQVVYINNIRKKRIRDEHNKNVINASQKFKPDILFTMNGSSELLPETIDYIKKNVKCKIISYVADNPFDPLRNKYFGTILPKFDVLLVADNIWIPNIKKIAPNSHIIHFVGGFDKNLFFPVSEGLISESEKDKLSCEVSFTGGSYNGRGEGNYRAGIMSHLLEFDLKIWGDPGWQNMAKYFPGLKYAYKGNRLSYDNLRKLYAICPINLNMPSPQILTSFQPRLFDIAATKGFQLVDHGSDICKYFDNQEVVTFQSIPDLKDKINYYLNNRNERDKIVENCYKKVINNYTWEHSFKRVLDYLANNF